MAGTDNQRRLAALGRLRQRTQAEDSTLGAWSRSTDEVDSIDAEIQQLRADYQARLVALRAKRDDAVMRRGELLAEVACSVGDDRTARLLDIPLRQVRDAHRSADRAGRAREGGGVARLDTVRGGQPGRSPTVAAR